MLPVVAPTPLATKVKASLIREADTTPRARSRVVIPNRWIPFLAVEMPTQRPAGQTTALPPNRLLLTSMSRTPSTRSRTKPPLPARLLLPLPPAHRLRQETAVDHLTHATIAIVTNGTAATANQTDTAGGHDLYRFMSNDVLQHGIGSCE